MKRTISESYYKIPKTHKNQPIQAYFTKIPLNVNNLHFFVSFSRIPHFQHEFDDRSLQVIYQAPCDIYPSNVNFFVLFFFILN